MHIDKAKLKNTSIIKRMKNNCQLTIAHSESSVANSYKAMVYWKYYIAGEQTTVKTLIINKLRTTAKKVCEPATLFLFCAYSKGTNIHLLYS